MSVMSTFELRVATVTAKHAALVTQANAENPSWDNGVFERWANPVITAEHVPLDWRFDFDPRTNPYFLERLGVDNFQFWAEPLTLPDTDRAVTNIYDMRLTQHADGWIYGVFCIESKDPGAVAGDNSSAITQCGIARTKDLVVWERLPNIRTEAKQQRNVVLHPELIDGRYALYTRPQSSFMQGSDVGIGFAMCDDLTDPVLEDAVLLDDKYYHSIKEVKSGPGAAPIKTDRGWLHLCHGVRNTAAGMRYVLYVLVTDLDDPATVTAISFAGTGR